MPRVEVGKAGSSVPPGASSQRSDPRLCADGLGCCRDPGKPRRAAPGLPAPTPSPILYTSLSCPCTALLRTPECQSGKELGCLLLPHLSEFRKGKQLAQTAQRASNEARVMIYALSFQTVKASRVRQKPLGPYTLSPCREHQTHLVFCV